MPLIGTAAYRPVMPLIGTAAYRPVMPLIGTAAWRRSVSSLAQPATLTDVVRIPECATHYHLRGREPFLNLSDLSDEGVAAVLSELDAVAEAGRSERRFGPRYMALRRATEQRLRERFIACGGRPQRLSPHYFVLGESEWFKRLYVDAAEVRVPLNQFPSDVTSLTYPDSVVSMGLLSDFGVATVAQPYHGTVYRLDDLPQVVEEYGLPNDTAPQTYDGYQRRPGEHFIEVQLWSDEPLGRFC